MLGKASGPSAGSRLFSLLFHISKIFYDLKDAQEVLFWWRKCRRGQNIDSCAPSVSHRARVADFRARHRRWGRASGSILSEGHFWGAHGRGAVPVGLEHVCVKEKACNAVR